MARSRGQIRQRGDEKYLIRVYLGRVDGKRKYKSKTVYGDEDHAEEKLTEMLRRKDQGRLRAESTKKLDEFADEWLESRKSRIKPATYDSYEMYIRVHIKPGLGYRQLEELTPRLIQRFINDLTNEKDLGAGYVRNIFTCLKAILGRAQDWGLIHGNPAERGIELPQRQSREYRTMDEGEIGDFLEAAKDHRLYALWVLLVAAGLRPQEAFGLKWDDLDDDGWLQVRRVVSNAPDDEDRTYTVSDDMKTEDSRREIKLSEDVQEILESHRARQAKEMLEAGEEYVRAGYIFTRAPSAREPGEFLYREYVRSDFKDLLDDAGLPSEEIRMYDLRHTHITRLILNGTDLKLASKRAGHSSIQQTADTYAHLGREAEEEMAETTEQFLQEALA